MWYTYIHEANTHMHKNKYKITRQTQQKFIVSFCCFGISCPTLRKCILLPSGLSHSKHCAEVGDKFYTHVEFKWRTIFYSIYLEVIPQKTPVPKVMAMSFHCGMRPCSASLFSLLKNDHISIIWCLWQTIDNLDIFTKNYGRVSSVCRQCYTVGSPTHCHVAFFSS